MRWRFLIPLLVLWASIATAANISDLRVSKSDSTVSSRFLPAHCESWSFSCLFGWLRPARRRFTQVSVTNSGLAPNDFPITVAPSWPATTIGVQPGVAASSWATPASTDPVSKDCGNKPCPGPIPTRSVIRIKLLTPEQKESGNRARKPGAAISDRVWYVPLSDSYFPQRQGPALIAGVLFTTFSICVLLLYRGKAGNVTQTAEATVTAKQANVDLTKASYNQMKESFDRKVAELNASLESEIKTVEGLKSENANLENWLKVSNKKLEDNSNGLAETTRKLEDSSNKLADTTTKLEATNTDLEAANKRAADGVVVKSQQATEIERLRGDLRAAKDDSQSKSSDIRSTRTELQVEQELRVSAEKSVEELQAQLSLSQEETQSALEKHDKLEDDIYQEQFQAHEQLEDAKKTISSLSTEVQQKDQARQQSEKARQVAEQARATADEERLKAERALAEVSKNIGSDQVDSSKLQEDLQKERVNSSQLREALSNEQAASSKLHNDLRQKEAEASKLQDDLRETKAHSSKVGDGLRKEKANSTKMQEDLRKEKASSSKLRQDLQKAHSDSSKIEDDILKERSKLSKLQDDIEKEKIVTTQQRKQIEQVTSKMQHEKATHNAHVQAHNTTMERLRGEIDEADYKLDDQRRQFTRKIALLAKEFSECRELLKSTQSELLSIKEKGTKPRAALQDILGDLDLDPAAPMSPEIFEAGRKQILDLFVKQLDRVPYHSRYIFRRQRTTEAFERWLDETVSVSSLTIDQFRTVLKNALKFVDETQTLVDKYGWPWSKSIHPRIFSRRKDNAFPADNDSLANLQQKVRGDEVAPPDAWATAAAAVPLPSQIVYPYGLQSLDTGLTVWTVVAEDYLRAFRGDRGRGKKNGQNEPPPSGVENSTQSSSQAAAPRADAPEGPNPSVAHLPAQSVSFLTDPAQTSANPPIFGGPKGFNQSTMPPNNAKSTSSTPTSGTFNHSSGLRRKGRKIAAHTGSKKPDDTTVSAPTGPRATQKPPTGPFTFGPNSGSFLFHNNGTGSPGPAQSVTKFEKVVAPSSAGLDDSRWATAGPIGTQPRSFSSDQIPQSGPSGQQSAATRNPTLNDSKYVGPQLGTASSEPSTARVTMPANSSWPPTTPAPAPPSSSQNVATNLERSYNTLPPPLAPSTRPATRPSLSTSNVFSGIPPPSTLSPNAPIFNFPPSSAHSTTPPTANSASQSVPPPYRKIKKTRRTLRKPGTKTSSATGDDASSVATSSEMFSEVSAPPTAAAVPPAGGTQGSGPTSATAPASAPTPTPVAAATTVTAPPTTRALPPPPPSPPARTSSPPSRNGRAMTPIALPFMPVGANVKKPDDTTIKKPDETIYQQEDSIEDRADEERESSASMIRDAVGGLKSKYKGEGKEKGGLGDSKWA